MTKNKLADKVRSFFTYTKTCPNCKEKNSENALVCFCGYYFDKEFYEEDLGEKEKGADASEKDTKEKLPLLFRISMWIGTANVIYLIIWGLSTPEPISWLYWIAVLSFGLGLYLLGSRKLWGLYIISATLVFAWFSLGAINLLVQFPGAIIHVVIMIRYSAWLD